MTPAEQLVADRLRAESYTMPKRTKRNRSPKLRQFRMEKIAAEKGAWRCNYCNLDISPTSGNVATLDHIIPLTKGGRDDESNICLACDFCNQAKNSYNLGQFRQWLHWLQNFAPKVQL